MNSIDTPKQSFTPELANSSALQKVLNTGNFDGIGVTSDYMFFGDRHFSRLTNNIGNIQEQVSADKQIKKITRQTSDPHHSLVQLRKRKIALDFLLPVIAELPELTFPESNNPHDDRERKINLVYTVMFLATGFGSKSWPIGFQELLGMKEDARVAAIKEVFAKERNESLFKYYKSGDGELGQAEYITALDYVPTPEEIELARENLKNAATKMFQTTEMVDDSLALAGAKITKAMNPVTDNVLLAESMIFDNRFTPPIPKMPDFLK